jgi:methylenetetrahydrofolate dehydrogenase (NADP+)/methenyltetrahydrofolate cyclohydrolase
MSARILDGTSVATAIREELRPRIAAFIAAHGRPPGLGIVLAGSDPASEIYVRNKLKKAEEIGLRDELTRVGADARAEDVLAVVRKVTGEA